MKGHFHEPQNIILCPQCGSNKVRQQPLILSMFFATGCLAWIPIIGWILAPISLIWTLILALLGKNRKIMQCQECKHSFSVSKKTYKEFKKHLNSFYR